MTCYIMAEKRPCDDKHNPVREKQVVWNIPIPVDGSQPVSENPVAHCFRVLLMFRYPEEKIMVSNSQTRKKQNNHEMDESISPEIEFEPLEETFPDEDESFSEVFHRLERDRSLGHDESFY